MASKITPLPEAADHPDNASTPKDRTRSTASAHFRLVEREKELRCVYEITRALVDERLSPRQMLRRIVEQLPPAMQYPADTAARITVAEHSVETPGFRRSSWCLAADIDVNDDCVGRIEVVYLRRHRRADEGPFLAEERAMLENIALVLGVHFQERNLAGELDHVTAEARRLRGIIDDSPAVAFIWHMTEDWPVAFVSENVRQFGYSAQILYDGTVRYADIVHPEDRDRVGEEVKRYLAEGRQHFKQSYRIVAADGGVRWIDDYTTVLRNDAGEATQTQGIIVDVTEQVRTQERAQRYLELAGTMFLALDCEGVVRAVNPRTCEITGESEADLVGRNWIECFVPQELQELVRSLFADLIAAAPDVNSGEYQHDIVLGSGQRRTIQWYYGIDLDSSGDVSGVIKFGADVTEQRRMQSALSRFAKFPRENPNPVLRIDRNGDVLLANPVAQEIMQSLAEDRGPTARQTYEAWSDMKEHGRAVMARSTHEIEIAGRSYVFDIVPIHEED